jgi:hypothetical protein
MSVPDQITIIRKELGITDHRIPTSKSRQKNLLAHLRIQLERKKKIERQPTSEQPVTEEKKDTSNLILKDEPNNRAEFVQRVASFPELSTPDAVRAAAEDLHCRCPSLHTYYLWEADVRRKRTEGVKVITDQHVHQLNQKANGNETTEKDNETPVVTPTPNEKNETNLVYSPPAERAAFVQMVYEYAFNNKVTISVAAAAVSTNLGVKQPSNVTICDWKSRYHVEVPELRGLLTRGKGQPRQLRQNTEKRPNTTETVIPTIDFICEFIKNASTDDIVRIKEAIECSKQRRAAEIDREIERLKAEYQCNMEDLRNKRNSLLGQ